MLRNTCLFYHDATEVYDKLLLFCTSKGFKVVESNEKFYFLTAKKKSIFFWRTLRLELEIVMVEKVQVQVTARVFKLSKRQPEKENEFIIDFENFLKK